MFKLKRLFRFLTTAVVIMSLVSLFGCAALHTSIAKRKLDVQTKTSTAIFVDPVKRKFRTVYVDIRSGVMEFDRREFKKSVLQEFSQNDNGYRVTDDPDAAQYHMTVVVLTLEKASPTAAELALKKGYVGTGGGMAAGAALGATRGTGKPW